jgi:epoxyqueuosine reductase QueG
MIVTSAQKKKFAADPAEYLSSFIRDYIATSVNNRFLDFPDEPIWDEPLIGIASGSDPLFQEYKKIIGEYHLTPREIIDWYIDTTARGNKNKISAVSVISFAFPATLKTRESNRHENEICSVRWNRSRFEGQETVARLSRRLVALIEDMGHIAIAPELSRAWEIVNTPSGLSSKWSQRHVAYAAGLGTFSLNDGFITPKGIAIRVGSVVCDLDLPVTPRKYANHYANCLFLTKGTCKKCADRCPAGAISEKGHDKGKCGAHLNKMREIAIAKGRIQEFIGKAYLGCGFCQTGVPCEDRIPLKS